MTDGEFRIIGPGGEVVVSIPLPAATPRVVPDVTSIIYVAVVSDGGWPRFLGIFDSLDAAKRSADEDCRPRRGSDPTWEGEADYWFAEAGSLHYVVHAFAMTSR